MTKRKDISGNKYGRLTVVEYIGKLTGSHRWRTKCDCGNIVIRTYSALENKSTNPSCGCYMRDLKTKYTSTTRRIMNNVWNGMKSRCMNPNTNNYHNYGGRGIAVCDRWINSFDNFCADMGDRPSMKHQIERINNNEGYSKENCIWELQINQARNKRTNVSVLNIYTGIFYNTIREAAISVGDKTDITYKNIYKGIGQFVRC